MKIDMRLMGIFLMLAPGLALARGQSAPAPSVQAQATQGQPVQVQPVQAKASATSVRPDTATSSASASAAETSTDSVNADEYVISPEDVLSVYVYDVPELSRDYTVSTAGYINVPLLTKPVRAAGMTLTQFSHSLEESFRQSGVLSNPRVSVDVRQSRRSVVAVEGAVKSPQEVPVIGRSRLASILDRCGGLTDDAGSTITVTRGAARVGGVDANGQGATVISVEAKKLEDTSDPMYGFEVLPGDRVYIPRAGVFYVLGQVGRPGGYNLKTAQEQVTVLQALAIAGDVTGVAKKSKAKIIRKDPKAPNGWLEVALNVKDIIAGRSPDPVLQRNDILYVPASGPKQVGRALTQSAVSIVTTAGSAAVYTR